MDERNARLLKILQKDCTLPAEQIATMLGISAEETKARIAELEEAQIILGYKAVVDWDRAAEDAVTALIEVKVTPQADEGFDRIAKRVYQYEEVESMYLMSGGFDFTVIVTGKSLRDVAHFVSSRLSQIDGITGTATHFILKKYKEQNVLFQPNGQQQERPIFV